MTRMNPEVRKQQLIHVALKQFLTNGYEQTSIRSIVGKADGKIGMFYHHFESKEAIYEAALRHYNQQFIKKLTKIIHNSSLTLEEAIVSILQLTQNAIAEYMDMKDTEANAEVMRVIHAQTLQTLTPYFKELLFSRSTTLEPEEKTAMTDFFLYGISSVLHHQPSFSLDTMQSCLQYILTMLRSINVSLSQ